MTDTKYIVLYKDTEVHSRTFVADELECYLNQPILTLKDRGEDVAIFNFNEIIGCYKVKANCITCNEELNEALRKYAAEYGAICIDGKTYALRGSEAEK